MALPPPLSRMQTDFGAGIVGTSGEWGGCFLPIGAPLEWSLAEIVGKCWGFFFFFSTKLGDKAFFCVAYPRLPGEQ